MTLSPCLRSTQCRTIVLQILQYHASFEQISLFAGISMPLMIFSLINPTFFVFAPAAAPVCSATALGLCLFCVIVCCRLGSLESVAMVPIGCKCPPPSILFSHLLPKLLISVRIRASVRSFRRTHTHVTCTHIASIFVHACFFVFKPCTSARFCVHVRQIRILLLVRYVETAHLNYFEFACYVRQRLIPRTGAPSVHCSVDRAVHMAR